jgi:hypothetical protein
MLRIVAIITNTKFDPFQQCLKGFYNYFYEKNLATLDITWDNLILFTF